MTSIYVSRVAVTRACDHHVTVILVAVKDAIAQAQAYDETYFEAIHDNLLGFAHVTVAGMLKHLTEQCLTLTFKEKKKKLKKNKPQVGERRRHPCVP